MLTITHTQPEGTLIEGTSRGDGTAEILKACGWRWPRNLGSWYVPQSRDKVAKPWITNNTHTRLQQAAGHDVTVTIDDTYRTTTEVEADKIARQAAHVDALEAKANADPKSRHIRVRRQASERHKAGSFSCPPR